MLLKLLSRILLIYTLIVFAVTGKAQTPFQSKLQSNLRIRKIPIKGDTVFLEQVSIIPYTFNITGIDSSTYKLDFVRSVLYWKIKPSIDTVLLTYRVFPTRLNSYIQRLNFDSVVNNVYLRPFEFDDNKNSTVHNMVDFGTIQYNGSFGRELSFGNNQNAVVNSTFQLQLSGMLKDSIEIAAALTDNNIPIQPDGTTKQLNEFDQVYLQFKKKNWQLNLGDIDLRQNQMYFLNFYKRL